MLLGAVSSEAAPSSKHYIIESNTCSILTRFRNSNYFKVSKPGATRASRARERGTAIVYVTRCGDDIAGFYTLSIHSIAREEVSGGWFRRNALSQVPAILLGMLGVDERYQGLGLGAQLLRDAILNSLKVSELAGAKALVVDPTGETAPAFYRCFGFSDLPGTARMILRLL